MTQQSSTSPGPDQTYYIIIGEPWESRTVPFVKHLTITEARDEAYRLAAKHPEKVFIILQAQERVNAKIAIESRGLYV